MYEFKRLYELLVKNTELPIEENPIRIVIPLFKGLGESWCFSFEF
jgi:hypothetical protein